MVESGGSSGASTSEQSRKCGVHVPTTKVGPANGFFDSETIDNRSSGCGAAADVEHEASGLTGGVQRKRRGWRLSDRGDVKGLKQHFSQPDRVGRGRGERLGGREQAAAVKGSTGGAGEGREGLFEQQLEMGPVLDLAVLDDVLEGKQASVRLSVGTNKGRRAYAVRHGREMLGVT
jgi:hypothetical protein